MAADYYRLKELLGRRSGRVDILSGSDIQPRDFMKKGWLEYLNGLKFLNGQAELTEEEEGWLGSSAEEFLKFLEKTPMTKAYKVPTIGALLEEGTLLERVGLDRVGDSLRRFYVESNLHQKDLREKSNKGWESWGPENFTELARKNPVHFLSKSEFFNYDEINKVFYLAEELEPYLGPELAGHVKDVLEYRRVNYFRRRFKEE